MNDVTDETLIRSATLPTLGSTGSASSTTTLQEQLCHQITTATPLQPPGEDSDDDEEEEVDTTQMKKMRRKCVRISLDQNDDVTDTSHDLESIGTLWRDGILRNSPKPTRNRLREADVKTIHSELMGIHRLVFELAGKL